MRLKVELEADQCSDDGSAHSLNTSTAAAAAVLAADHSNGNGGGGGGASQAALQQAMSQVTRGSGGSADGGLQSSDNGDSLLGRHMPRLSRITSHLHLRHTISRANPFRAVRSLSRRVQTSSDSGPCVVYEVGRAPCNGVHPGGVPMASRVACISGCAGIPTWQAHAGIAEAF